MVVSNTFTRYGEAAPYLSLAVELRKTYSIITAEGQYQNIHNVPQDIIANMQTRWEQF